MAATYDDLKGKTVVVTGGGSGIGAAIVEAFSGQGANVGFIDIADAPSEALAAKLTSSGGRVRFEHADLKDIDALKQAIANIRAAFGPIQILINNAAHDERHATLEVTPQFWDDRIAVNLRHQFFAAQAVLPDMQAAKAGSIINFGSVSWMIGQGGMAAYTAAKSAVLGLTRSLARDFGPYNIRVNSIAPGWIMTERQLGKWLTPAGEEELMQRQCLKRRLLPAEVARVALFLSSDEASACTNQSYIVDGGWV
ncbi:NAD(P)-dependent dehydrogenase, short-chain alcohol dehydrogenase family [Arboricoccus pini]|uniref:NAD(P)-dependent dehydrogenase, short-chain alcohol dehydrogenase family n=1 Tax=Arboricoccus pini TaxID=1963835 RepID=A0A212PXM7_9PROT|nr:SDR family NAD(P)-dependent oxidoreductase [Arboricoccus pini]SNB51813.1 NAD(P)-dependent dehydrogenase, short-chain alcohol dehydrogenase family [Arboricoccus pini]